MRKLALILIAIFPAYLFAATWNVGPAKTYTKPSQVAPLVNHGDTVYIGSANYTGDVCAWTKNNPVLIGVNGRPHLRAHGIHALGKGIWVFSGNNITAKKGNIYVIMIRMASYRKLRYENNYCCDWHLFFNSP